MKKIFTSFCSKRALLSAAFVVTSALSALAGGEDWYAYNVQVDAYPTGAGVVYVDTVALDETKYAETVTREFTTTKTLLNGYAKANDGWQLLGFAKDSIDAAGMRCQVDSVSILYEEWYGYYILSPLEGETSKHLDPETGLEVSDDSATVAAKMPLEPNNYFRAIFTHVAVKVADNQEPMGKVTISKLANNIGEKVTIEAIPANEYCSFVNWTVDGKEVSTAAKLEVEVKGIANYVANFKDSRSVTLKFPAEGGYQVWYNDKYDYMLNDLLTSTSPILYYTYDNSRELVDSLNQTTGARESYLTSIAGSYMATGKTPAVFYGMGEVTISPASAEETVEDESFSCHLFRWSGDEGAIVDSLPGAHDTEDITYAYYTFDIDKMQFNHITTGKIAPKSLYMRVFTNMFGAGLEAPEVIYFDQATYETAGISTVKSVAVDKKAIYDLQGRRVSTPAKGGIYITDGRKIFYRAK